MADEKYVSKVVVNNQVKIDLTGDTIAPEDVINGKTFHDRSGAPKVGTSTYDADTSDATAKSAEILLGKTGYVAGQKVTGTMPNNGAVNLVISNKDSDASIPAGYHDGSGKVAIDSTEKDKLVPTNIREGVDILGVTGTMSGTEAVVAGSPTVTPTFAQQTVVPDASKDENYLSQVTINPIPVSEVENEQGGITLTIG